MAKSVEVDRQLLEYLCRRYNVERISLFGSVLREDFGPQSDVDAIVEFEQGRTPGFGFVRLQRELSELIGNQIDLHTYHSLSRYFRDEVMRESEVLYERIPQLS